ncbi:MAG: biotin/lipoyl-binding protein, partial [Phycisphaerales bacterium]|nr:biotin/lipoyl-binding protein [Phycisphaerales bacterium]
MPRRLAQSPVRAVLWIAAFLAIGGFSAWAAMLLIRPTVTATRAVEGPVVQAFYSTGTIQPRREFPVRANVAGILQQVLVDKGDRVRAGDPLAVVHEPALQFALDKAQAELNEKLARADEQQSPVLQEFDRRIAALAGMLEIAQREQARQTAALELRAGSQAD